MFASGSPSAVLLAILIGLQNLPEGFNAYREFSSGRRPRRKKAVLFMSCLVPLGPLMGLAGWLIGPVFPEFVGGVMLFSAGGILYLIFQDIAPQSRLDRHWVPPLGAVLGFCLGMFAHVLTGA